MAYPISAGNDADTADGINYLLSGPAGLGQNFQGYSAYTPGYITGNFRTPYNSTTAVPLYVAPIALGVSEVLAPGNIWKFNFATPQATAPFTLGSPIVVAGTADPVNYDGSYAPIGVVECTTTYVIARTRGFFPGTPPTTGGTVFFTAIAQGFISTDCNARVTVTGATDRVFVSAQINNLLSYTATTLNNLTYTVAVNRYQGFVNNDPINPDYTFPDFVTVSQKTYSGGVYSGLIGSGTIDQETIFSTVVDSPPVGYYWYILEVKFDTTGDLQITQCETGLRSLSAQVVKP